MSTLTPEQKVAVMAAIILTAALGGILTGELLALIGPDLSRIGYGAGTYLAGRWAIHQARQGLPPREASAAASVARAEEWKGDNTL